MSLSDPPNIRAGASVAWGFPLRFHNIVGNISFTYRYIISVYMYIQLLKSKKDSLGRWLCKAILPYPFSSSSPAFILRAHIQVCICGAKPLCHLARVFANCARAHATPRRCWICDDAITTPLWTRWVRARAPRGEPAKSFESSSRAGTLG